MAGDTPGAPSSRSTVRRGASRARYGRDVVNAILDEGMVAHIGVQTPQGPLVLPMAYGHDGTTMYLHGALGNSILGSSATVDMCATVTLVDGLVLARNAFHNSMNYRCVVVRGTALRVKGRAEHERALRLITDHVVANWDNARAPSDAERRRTLVLALPLDEASAKVREGDPVDDPEDLDGPHWAGTVSVSRTYGTPTPAVDLIDGIPVPDPVLAAFGGG